MVAQYELSPKTNRVIHVQSLKLEAWVKVRVQFGPCEFIRGVKAPDLPGFARKWCSEVGVGIIFSQWFRPEGQRTRDRRAQATLYNTS